MAKNLFIIVDFVGSCLLLFFNYKFQQVEDVLKEEKSLDILLDPIRIFNGDESCLIFPKGWKRFSI